MRAVIICGGLVSDYAYIKAQIKETDTVICADSGYDHAVNMGIKADIIVGDFDSISRDSIRQIPKDVNKIRYPQRKDKTDSEIALDHARSMGFRDFLLIGATGSRLDHTLTNILLLKTCLDRGENAVVTNEHNKIMITGSVMQISEKEGTTISLIPLSKCYGVTTENLEYPLNNATLDIGEGRGVSNVMVCENAFVSVKKGIMLVVAAKD